MGIRIKTRFNGTLPVTCHHHPWDIWVWSRCVTEPCNFLSVLSSRAGKGEGPTLCLICFSELQVFFNSQKQQQRKIRKTNPDSAVGSQEVLLGECLTGKFTERSSQDHHRVFVIVSNGVNININIISFSFFAGIAYIQC